MSTVLLLAAIIGAGAAAEPPSVEFSDGAGSEVDFEKSVVFGALENDVNPFAGDEFLRNFKTLHNETDLQALASEDQPVAVITAPAADIVNSRSDNGPRVLRGVPHDLAASSLETPPFFPFRHNKIDTADFSDCALQGEWKPMGVPQEHYTHHAEDHQKEHFHTLAETPDMHHSQSAHSHHSPLDAEGVAFWNQFVKETNGNLHFMQHEKFPKRPSPHHQHHQKKKKHHKSQSNHHSGHVSHHHPSLQQKQPNIAPPPPTSFQGSVDSLDVFESLRNPHGSGNLFQIHAKPSLEDDALLQQNLLAPQIQSVDTADFALVHGADPLTEGFPPYPVQVNHDSAALNTASYQNSGPSASQTAHLSAPEAAFLQESKNNDESYLSPPPLPQHRFPKPERPRLEQRPKFVQKPHRPAGPPQKFKSGPRRPPPPVTEHSEDHRGGFQQHHLPNQHDHLHHQHQHDQSQLQHGHLHHQHDQLHHQHKGGDSSFTCGHEHAEGTNYHTASYQVEGEADPSLLDDVITGNSHLDAPIIVGQPIFGQERPSGPSATLEGHDFTNQNGLPLDLEEEGSEQTGSHLRFMADKLVQPSSTAPDNVTPSSTLGTTAPQTFKPEVTAPPDSFSTHKQKQFSDDSQPAASSAFDIGFDHSGFSEVGVHNSHKQFFADGNKEFNIAADPEYQKIRNSHDHHPVFSHEKSVGFSEPNSFFTTKFGPSFSSGVHGFDKLPSGSLPTSFTDFSNPSFHKSPSGHKAPIAVFDHTPFNKTTTKPNSQPPKKRPSKPYEVSEDSGENIPISALFPPKKMPKQFDMRMPNLANPNAKRPLPPSKPPQNKFKSSIHFEGSNVGVYTTHPRNKVTKIRLKMKNRPNSGPPRISESDFRKGLTIKPRLH